MALEIERKYLLLNDDWRALVARSQKLAQGYLGSAFPGLSAEQDQGRSSVRVRVAGEQAWLNIKARQRGHSRLEYEYAIPLADAEEMLAQCANHGLEKIRHWLPWGDVTFEIDEFLGANQGLVVAEVELSHPDQSFPRPAWLGAEVTDDLRYYNNELAQRPWSEWRAEERGTP